MPPKKKEEPKERPVLGRFKSHLKIGIVGLPNVGKSTLFNVLTKLSIPAENFPFCTIEPNSARVHVPDERFTWLCDTYKPKSEVAAYLDVVDIAGLVKGAAEGEGLGNNFLSHIAAVDGIFHVLRAFEDPDVTHVEDRVDPVADVEIINGRDQENMISPTVMRAIAPSALRNSDLHRELRAKDLERISDHLSDLESRNKRQSTKEVKEELEIAQKVQEWLKEGNDVRFGDWNNKEVEFLNSNPLITSKPVVYLVNLTQKAFISKKAKWLPKIHAWVQSHGGEPIIPFSGAFESHIFDMPEDEKDKYCKENVVVSALPKIITIGFRAIQLIYFFTAGEDEVKCWQIRKGSKAPQAAGAIHSDFERGFICAEVMTYAELHEAGTESAVKAAGKYRQQGKNYVVQDGDVIFFKFNVTSTGKK